MYIFAKNDLKIYPFDISTINAFYKGVSFPDTMSEDVLASYNVFPVKQTEAPTYNEFTQGLEETVNLIDGVWTQQWEVYDLSDSEIETINKKARQWRDSELERTDILAVLPDYPNKEALLTYRQALRDWTATQDFPDTRPVMGG